MTTVFGSATPCRRAARFGGLPNDASFLRLARANQIADHHKAGRNPHANLEGELAAATHFGTASDPRAPRARHRPRGPAGSQSRRLHHRAYTWPRTRRTGRPLPQRICDMPDHGPQIFRVEPSRQRGRPDEVGEHDSELSTFRAVLRARRRRDRDRRWRWDVIGVLGNRAHYFAAVTE
jgi:hypothetical protein